MSPDLKKSEIASLKWIKIISSAEVKKETK